MSLVLIFLNELISDPCTFMRYNLNNLSTLRFVWFLITPKLCDPCYNTILKHSFQTLIRFFFMHVCVLGVGACMGMSPCVRSHHVSSSVILWCNVSHWPGSPSDPPVSISVAVELQVPTIMPGLCTLLGIRLGPHTSFTNGGSPPLAHILVRFRMPKLVPVPIPQY